MNIYLVYKHTSPSGKSYIGITKNYTHRNWIHQHTLHCRVFAAAIKKYGWSAFTHEILVDNITLREANALEQIFISEHNTLVPHGYNLTTGGKVTTVSDQTKQKQSDSRKLRITSESTRLKMSLAKLGKPLLESHRAQITKGSQGKNVSRGARAGLKRAYTITDPDGHTYTSDNLKKFCSIHDLNAGCMQKVASGLYKQHHGWKCVYINLTPESELG